MFKRNCSLSTHVVLAADGGFVFGSPIDRHLAVSASRPHNRDSRHSYALLHQNTSFVERQQSRFCNKICKFSNYPKSKNSHLTVVIENSNFHDGHMSHLNISVILGIHETQFQEELLIWLPLVVVDDFNLNLIIGRIY